MTPGSRPVQGYRWSLLAGVALLAASNARATTSSPDAWGYCWTDAVTYNWYDATAGGTQLQNNGDVNFGFVNMPFSTGSFSFYGNVFAQVAICNNGWLSFMDSRSTDFSAQTFPAAVAPNSLISVYKHHLLANGSNTAGCTSSCFSGSPSALVFYKLDPGPPERFVVEWRNVQDSGSGLARFTFEAILNTSDNSITMQYQCSPNWSFSAGGSIGIENNLGTVGQSWPGPPTNCSAIRFFLCANTPTPTASQPATATPVTYSVPYCDSFDGAHPAADWQADYDTYGHSPSIFRGAPTPGTRAAPTAPAAYSAPNCWGWNLNNGGYHDLESSWVNSPYIQLPSTPCYLQFRNWYDLEPGYDSGLVVIVTNAGTTYNFINPLGGYPAAASSFFIGSNVGCYSGTQSTWAQETFDLSAFASQPIQVEFWLASDPINNRAGWYVDDVCVISQASPTATRSATSIATPSPTATASSTASDTATVNPSFSRTPSGTETPTATVTATATETGTPTSTATPCRTATDSASATLTATHSETPLASATSTNSGTASATNTPASTPTATTSASRSATPAPTLSGAPPYLAPNRNVFRPDDGPLLISFDLAETVDVRLTVFNSAGERVAELWRGAVPAFQPVSVPWNGTNERGEPVASNVYVVRLSGRNVWLLNTFALER